MASKINKGEILAKFFDDGEYTALFADGAVSAACGYAAGQQAYAVYQNGEAVTVKDVEKNIKVLEMAAQTGCPVVTFYNSVGAKLAEGLDVLTASAKLNAQIATSSWLKAHAWFWLRMGRARISSVLSKRPVKRLSLCWMVFSSKTKTLPALLSIGSACGKLIIRNGERS